MAKKVQVSEYLAALNHPLKPEIEALRQIIRQSNPKLNERIKWNAPSYYYQDDIVTFGPMVRNLDQILLVFHHPSIVRISEAILQGTFKDRRLVTFTNMEEIVQHQDTLVRIMNQIIETIDEKYAEKST